MEQPKPSVTLASEVSNTAVALVWGSDLAPSVAPEAPPEYLRDLISSIRDRGESFWPEGRKAAVRDMLRRGKYKPSGRSKPSSEYLLSAALSEAISPERGGFGTFPLVNPAVDINNAVSLQWGYPASVFDATKTGPALFVRYGGPGESYVFNQSGQTIDLEDLLVVCRPWPGSTPAKGNTGGWQPCGNPVKDAMETKVFSEARDVLGVVYAPVADARDESGAQSPLGACAARYASLLREVCGARSSGFLIISP